MNDCIVWESVPFFHMLEDQCGSTFHGDLAERLPIELVEKCFVLCCWVEIVGCQPSHYSFYRMLKVYLRVWCDVPMIVLNGVPGF